MRMVPALDRGLQILEYIADHDTPCKPSDIIEDLGIPRSMTYELLHTMRVRGYLESDGEGFLLLGHLLFALGSRYGQMLDLTEIANSIASGARNATNETVQVALLENRHVVYIAKADPTRMVRLVSSVGRRLPAHCTAIGKALLAQLSDAELDRLLGDVELESLTPQSITELDSLRHSLHSIRAAGVAYDDRESNPEVCCVAAPAFGADGAAAVAVSISVPTDRMSSEHSQQLATAVKDAAAGLSARLGYLKPRRTDRECRQVQDLLEAASGTSETQVHQGNATPA